MYAVVGSPPPSISVWSLIFARSSGGMKAPETVYFIPQKSSHCESLRAGAEAGSRAGSLFLESINAYHASASIDGVIFRVEIQSGKGRHFQPDLLAQVAQRYGGFESPVVEADVGQVILVVFTRWRVDAEPHIPFEFTLVPGKPDGNESDVTQAFGRVASGEGSPRTREFARYLSPDVGDNRSEGEFTIQDTVGSSVGNDDDVGVAGDIEASGKVDADRKTSFVTGRAAVVVEHVFNHQARRCAVNERRHGTRAIMTDAALGRKETVRLCQYNAQDECFDE